MITICKKCNFISNFKDDDIVQYSCHNCNEINILERKFDQSVKSDEGKIDYTLLSIPALKELAKVRMFGVKKYGDRDSWRKVEPERFKQAMLRHMFDYLEGKSINEEDGGVRVLAQVLCNGMFLLDMEVNN